MVTSQPLPDAATASETLAGFAARLDFAALPTAVVESVKLHVLDTVGVALAAARQDFTHAAIAGVTEWCGGEGQCGVIGRPERLPAPWAALVNGTLAHGLDFDNTHQESVVHVSAGVVPAALAVGEQCRADGRSVIAAIAAGEETSIRIGLAAHGAFHDRGFHPTGICNTFGAATAAGKLAGLSADAYTHALGVCGSQAAGLFAFLTDGTWVKRLHGGWAAHGGIVAAALARHGFTGPRAVLDGRFGLYHTHLGDSGWDLAAVTAQLGERWELVRTALKPYPCCHYNHAFIDALAALQKGHSWAAAEVEHVACVLSDRQVPIVCEPLATKRNPQTDYDAKFSLPYAVACQIVRGHVDVDDYSDAAIRDPAILDLAARVSYESDPAADFPRRFGGRVRVRLRDGRVLAHAEPINRGSAERPLTADEVIDKFRRSAAGVLPSAKIDAVQAAIASLERLDDIALLMTALQPD